MNVSPVPVRMRTLLSGSAAMASNSRGASRCATAVHTIGPPRECQVTVRMPSGSRLNRAVLKLSAYSSSFTSVPSRAAQQYAAQVAAPAGVLVALVDVLEPVGVGDLAVQVEPAVEVEVEQPGYVVVRV